MTKTTKKQRLNHAQMDNKNRGCRLHLVSVSCYVSTLLRFYIATFLHCYKPHEQNYTTPHQQMQISAISHILANISYLLHFCRYVCDMCVSYLYYKPFLGIWSNIRPPPLFVDLWPRCLIKKFFSENFSLRIKIVLWKFFIYFFYL